MRTSQKPPLPTGGEQNLLSWMVKSNTAAMMETKKEYKKAGQKAYLNFSDNTGKVE